jgi:hypothetical protein
MPLKVVFIAGWGRSGTTLLDNLLGQVDGFFSTGELRYLWERGVLSNWRCGCGGPVTECDVWSAVLDRVGSVEGRPEARTVVEWQKSVARVRHTWKLLRLDSSQLPEGSLLQAYVRLIGHLFFTISEVTGAHIVVDSSKRPSDAAIINLVPSLRLYVVHLVRDPRAVAFSWAKRQPGIDRHGVLDSSVSWVVWNLACSALRRTIPERALLVRYEDFVREPSETMQRILELVREDPRKIPPSSERKFQLRDTHTVSGNPARFRTGSTQVRTDDEWVAGLGHVNKTAATLVTLPLLHHYGYRIRTPTGTS